MRKDIKPKNYVKNKKTRTIVRQLKCKILFNGEKVYFIRGKNIEFIKTLLFLREYYNEKRWFYNPYRFGFDYAGISEVSLKDINDINNALTKWKVILNQINEQKRINNELKKKKKEWEKEILFYKERIKILYSFFENKSNKIVFLPESYNKIKIKENKKFNLLETNDRKLAILIEWVNSYKNAVLFVNNMCEYKLNFKKNIIEIIENKDKYFNNKFTKESKQVILNTLKYWKFNKLDNKELKNILSNHKELFEKTYNNLRFEYKTITNVAVLYLLREYKYDIFRTFLFFGNYYNYFGEEKLKIIYRYILSDKFTNSQKIFYKLTFKFDGYPLIYELIKKELDFKKSPILRNEDIDFIFSFLYKYGYLGTAIFLLNKSYSQQYQLEYFIKILRFLEKNTIIDNQYIKELNYILRYISDLNICKILYNRVFILSDRKVGKEIINVFMRGLLNVISAYSINLLNQHDIEKLLNPDINNIRVNYKEIENNKYVKMIVYYNKKLNNKEKLPNSIVDLLEYDKYKNKILKGKELEKYTSKINRKIQKIFVLLSFKYLNKIIENKVYAHYNIKLGRKITLKYIRQIALWQVNLSSENKKIFDKLIEYYSIYGDKYELYLPENIKWIEKIQKNNVNINEWLYPEKKEFFIDNKKLKIFVSKHPFIIFLMGTYIPTCLQLLSGSINNISVLSNAYEANKQVIYIMDDNNNVLARKLIVISKSMKIVLYNTYLYDILYSKKGEIEKILNLYIRDISKKTGFSISNNSKKDIPEQLTKLYWYNDAEYAEDKLKEDVLIKNKKANIIEFLKIHQNDIILFLKKHNIYSHKLENLITVYNNNERGTDLVEEIIILWMFYEKKYQLLDNLIENFITDIGKVKSIVIKAYIDNDSYFLRSYVREFNEELQSIYDLMVNIKGKEIIDILLDNRTYFDILFYCKKFKEYYKYVKSKIIKLDSTIEQHLFAFGIIFYKLYKMELIDDIINNTLNIIDIDNQWIFRTILQWHHSIGEHYKQIGELDKVMKKYSELSSYNIEEDVLIWAMNNANHKQFIRFLISLSSKKLKAILPLVLIDKGEEVLDVIINNIHRIESQAALILMFGKSEAEKRMKSMGYLNTLNEKKTFNIVYNICEGFKNGDFKYILDNRHRKYKEALFIVFYYYFYKDFEYNINKIVDFKKRDIKNLINLGIDYNALLFKLLEYHESNNDKTVRYKIEGIISLLIFAFIEPDSNYAIYRYNIVELMLMLKYYFNINLFYKHSISDFYNYKQNNSIQLLENLSPISWRFITEEIWNYLNVNSIDVRRGKYSIAKRSIYIRLPFILKKAIKVIRLLRGKDIEFITSSPLAEYLFEFMNDKYFYIDNS